MLINDYFRFSENLYIITNLNHSNSESFFFKPKKSEFVSFYNSFGSNSPRDNFLKKLRYKNNYINNDFLNFTQILSRRGLMAKFRSYVIKLIKYLYFFNLNFNFFKMYDLGCIYKNYLVYSFDNILKINFLFKLTFHRLDKNVRKYNRKRKVKITFKYNYVPPFKRSKWCFKLLSKFVKFGNNKTFYSNLVDLSSDIIFSNKKNILHKFNEFTFRKIKNFSFQKTLIDSI